MRDRAEIFEKNRARLTGVAYRMLGSRADAEDIVQSYLAVEGCLAGSGLEPGLMYLLKMRASQINGCAYFIDMHSKDTRAAGETEQRLYGLVARRSSSGFVLTKKRRCCCVVGLCSRWWRCSHRPVLLRSG